MASLKDQGYLAMGGLIHRRLDIVLAPLCRQILRNSRKESRQRIKAGETPCECCAG